VYVFIKNEQSYASSNIVYQLKSENNQNVTIMIKEDKTSGFFSKQNFSITSVPCIMKQKYIKFHNILLFLVEDKRYLIKLLAKVYKIQ